MVLVTIKVNPCVRVEEQISCEKLKEDTGQRPHVCRSAISRIDDDFRSAILPRLDVLSEMFVHEAGVSQVNDLKRHLPIKRIAVL